MITESRTNIVTARLAGMLIAYQLDDRDREETALDIIELIALRLPNPTDIEVFNLGCFVRLRLALFLNGRSEYPDILNYFVNAALSAKCGASKFLKAIDCSGPKLRETK